MVCSSCYWKPELKDCKSDNSLSLTEMIGTTAKELPSKRALELSELKLITMFKTVSTLERGLGVERAKTPFFRGLPRRPTKQDDIHGANFRKLLKRDKVSNTVDSSRGVHTTHATRYTA